MSFLDFGMDAGGALSFDPGPTARRPGPWTRVRRSFTLPQEPVADGYFDPGLNVRVAGPLTRLRRSSAELDLDDLIPVDLERVERVAGTALRTAPVAAAVVGTVAISGSLTRSRPASTAHEAAPVARTAPVPQPVAEPAVRITMPPGQVEAKLVGRQAVLPDAAPRALKQVVAAANRIQGRPYSYGGGHGSFESAGYDCSGAVSYALHGAGLLESPLASGALAGWGEAGEGKAITVYAHGGHAYAVIAGLRWDTSGTSGSGPSWHADMRSPAGYAARHPIGL